MYVIPDFSSQGGNNPGGGQMDLGSLGGMSSTQNQYTGFPAMTSSASQTSNIPGIVPPASGFDPTFGAPGTGGGQNQPVTGANWLQGTGVGRGLPGGAQTGTTIDPQFTQMFDQYLRSQLGRGATPFDLSTLLPSSGQATTPGTLNAPMNSLMQSLNQFYQTGTGGPLPGVLPMWTSEMQSMNIPIQQQLANIKEQFGARGSLGSTEMATALEQFGSQTAADQETLLGQLTLQALPGMQTEAVATQQLDQASIDRMLTEFIRTQPEYSPLLGMESSLATTFPPIYNKKGGVTQGILGGAAGILGALPGLGSLLGGGAAAGGAAAGAGGAAGVADLAAIGLI